jgi:hypothetical protein
MINTLVGSMDLVVSKASSASFVLGLSLPSSRSSVFRDSATN